MPEYIVDVRVTVSATYLVDADTAMEAREIAEHNARVDAEDNVGNYGWADAYAGSEDVRLYDEEDDY